MWQAFFRLCAGAVVVTLAGAPALAAPSFTSAFTLPAGKTGLTGNPLVTADWTSLWTNGGDYFKAEPGAAYDVVVGRNANLYALNDNSAGGGIGPVTITLNGGSLTNYGTLNVVPNTYPNYSINNYFNTLMPAVSVSGDNTTITNYGTIGFQPVNAQMPYEAINIAGATNTTVNNYGALIGLHGVYGSGTNTWVNNHAGGKIIAWFGTPIEFPNGRNFQNGGLMNDIFNGSYCFHPGYLTTVFNWGYCIASANGFWLDQHNVSGTDYGGPLVPAAHDLDGNLVFNGNLTGDFAYSNAALGCDPGNNLASSPIQAVNDAVATLNNTVYSVSGSATQIVNYLPLTFGYPMINIASRTGQLIFNFSHLTAAQQAGFTAAVAASYGSFTDSSGTVHQHVSTGSYVLDGQAYQWCTFGTVTLHFSDTIVGRGIRGLPVPGVYSVGSHGRAYFTNAASKTNPYYQTNAATVQLTGNIAEPAGRLVVQPGWTLQLGNVARTLSGTTIVSNALDDAFSAGVAPGNSIELQSATATTTDNVDGVAGQTTTLHGALVIDNPTANVVLPNLSGGGWLVQSGGAKTSLSGTNNSFFGTIFLAKGTLAVAPGAHFSKAPVLMIGTNDASSVNKPVFDISAIGNGASFTLGELGTPGYQLQIFPNNYSDGLQYPTIALGNNTLIVGDGRVAHGTYLGALTGTGGLRIAGGTTLTFGPIAPADVTHQNPRIVPISTFSGGITVEKGGALEVQTEGGFGTGPVAIAGTISLASGTAYTPTQFNVTLPASDALPNHTLALPAGYTQASTGKLVLRVAQADAPAATASGAGVNYDTVTAAGAASLAGTLELTFINGYVPAAGDTLNVLTAAGVSGAFSAVRLAGVSGLVARQTVTGTGVLVTFRKG
jgi:hypothetical protein